MHAPFLELLHVMHLMGPKRRTDSFRGPFEDDDVNERNGCCLAKADDVVREVEFAAIADLEPDLVHNAWRVQTLQRLPHFGRHCHGAVYGRISRCDEPLFERGAPEYGGEELQAHLIDVPACLPELLRPYPDDLDQITYEIPSSAARPPFIGQKRRENSPVVGKHRADNGAAIVADWAAAEVLSVGAKVNPVLVRTRVGKSGQDAIAVRCHSDDR